MKRLAVFIGEGGCGKTTLIKKLVAEDPTEFRKIITITNRLPRTWDGEVNEVDYHFVEQDHDFSDPEFVIKKKTTEGFTYATRRSDLFPTTHHLLLSLRAEGVKRLADLGCQDFVVIRILISDELKLKRMRKRGDPEGMIQNRLRLETADRVDIDLGTIPLLDLDATETIVNKIAMIKKFLGD